MELIDWDIAINYSIAHNEYVIIDDEIRTNYGIFRPCWLSILNNLQTTI